MCVFLFWQALLISQAASCGHTQPDRAFCQQVRVQSHTDSDRSSLMLCYSPSSHICSLPWALIGILILFAWTQTVFKTAHGLKNSLGGSERESERWHSEGWTGVSYFTLEEWKLSPQGLEGSRELPARILLILAWMECILHVQETLKQTCICTQTCLKACSYLIAIMSAGFRIGCSSTSRLMLHSHIFEVTKKSSLNQPILIFWSSSLVKHVFSRITSWPPIHTVRNVFQINLKLAKGDQLMRQTRPVFIIIFW